MSFSTFSDDGAGSSRGAGSQHPIKIKVCYGSSLDEVIIPSESTFGDLKEVLANQTGIDPAYQRLLFRGRETDDSETLHMAGVKDLSKVLLVEHSASREQTEEILKACQAIAEVRTEVDKLSEKVANVETLVSNDVKLDQKEFAILTELLMRQLLKLDGIVAEGEAKAQRKNEVKRIQEYVDRLDALKSTNAHSSPAVGLY